MKNIISSLLVILLLAGVVYAEKPLFEYGGSKVYLDSTSYQDYDDYDGRGKLKLARNVQSQLTRTYVTGYMNLSDTSRVRLTLDSGGYTKARDGFYKDSYVFVKYLYWELKEALGFDKVMVGQIETPWIGFEDNIWGDRFVAKSVLDAYSIDNSADRGVGVSSKIGKDIDYAVAVIGGNGYKWCDHDGKMNTEARVSYKAMDNVQISVGGITGSKAYDQRYSEHYTYKVGMANVNYKLKPLTLSYTVFGTYRFDTIIGGVSTTYGESFGKGSSTTAIYDLFGGLDVIGRLDTLRANIKDENCRQDTIAGIGYKVNDSLKLAVTQQAVNTIDKDGKLADSTHVAKFNAELKF